MHARTIGLYALVSTLVTGAILGGTVSWALSGSAHEADVKVVEGYTTAVNESRTSLAVSVTPSATPESFKIAGAWWRENGGPWHDSPPACLQTIAKGQKVRLGVVEVHGKKDGAPAGPLVVWLECLSTEPSGTAS